MFYKMLMAGFDRKSSGYGNGSTVNWTTTTAQKLGPFPHDPSSNPAEVDSFAS